MEGQIQTKTSSGLGIRDLLVLSLRSFRLHPTRVFLTILGMSIGIGTVFFLVSLGYGLQYILIGKMVTTEESLFSLEAFYPGEANLTFTKETLNTIRNFPEVAEISEVPDLSGEIEAQNTSAYVLVKIIKPSYFRLSGTRMDYGETLKENEREIVITNLALRLLNLPENMNSLNKEVSVKVSIPDKEGKTETVTFDKSFKISGIIIDEFSPPTIYISQEWFKDKNLPYNRIFVKAKNLDAVNILKEKLINMGLLISAKLDLVRQAKQIMTIITLVLGIFGVTALLVAGIGMFNVMLTSFLEKIFEVGIMKSLGATGKDVRNLFLMESFLMSIIGGIGGILLGFLGGQVINLGLNILAKRLGGESINLFIFPWHFVILTLIISVVVGILSGYWPARRASKLSPREAFVTR
jgi:putative ABC transport system permease protein